MKTANAREASDAGRWPSNWLRATLPLLVLHALEARASYGYALIVRLNEAGMRQVKAGTLYALLTRLELSGWITATSESSQVGPARRYFTLTEDGRRELENQQRQWNRYIDVIAACLTSS